MRTSTRGAPRKPPEKHQRHRIVFRLNAREHERVTTAAASRNQTANDFARDRTLSRIRATRAQQTLALEGPAHLDELATYMLTCVEGLIRLQGEPGSPHYDLAEAGITGIEDARAAIATIRILIDQATNP